MPNGQYDPISFDLTYRPTGYLATGMGSSYREAARAVQYLTNVGLKYSHKRELS